MTAAYIAQEGKLWGYFVPEIGGGGASTREAAIRGAQELLSEHLAAGGTLPATAATGDHEGERVLLRRF